MEHEHLAQYRSQILADIESCTQDIERLEKSAAPVAPDNALGRLTRMDSMNDQGLGVAALNQKREKLYLLEQALKRINQPGFGLCARCQRPIPVERLMALPESTLCVPCAS